MCNEPLISLDLLISCPPVQYSFVRKGYELRYERSCSTKGASQALIFLKVWGIIFFIDVSRNENAFFRIKKDNIGKWLSFPFESFITV